MKRFKRVLSGTSAAVLSLSSLLTMGFTGVAHAAAQTCTWTGAGTDNKFSTVANWSNCGGGAPLAGDIIRFDQVQASVVALVNDLNVNLGGLVTATVASTNYEGYSVDKLAFAAGAVVSVEPGSTCSVRIARVSPVDITAAGDLTIQKESLGWSPYKLVTPGGLTVKSILGGAVEAFSAGSSANSVTLASPLGQAGYTTTTTECGSGGAGGSASGPVQNNLAGMTYSSLTVENGASISLADYSGPMTLGGGSGTAAPRVGFYPDTDTNTYAAISSSRAWSSALTLLSSTDIYVGDSTTVNFTGTISGAGKSLTKTADSTGAFTNNATSNTSATPTGSQVNPAKTTTLDGTTTDYITIVPNETAILNGQRASVSVLSDGTLKGTGTLTGSLWVSDGGHVAPGNSPGCLSVDTLNIQGEYQFDLGGTDPCTGYDQIKVTNKTAAYPTVVLDQNSVSTSVLTTARYNGYTPKQGQTFTIIDNQGTQPVQGTFKNLPEGATFDQNGILFKITYKGGDGNDVVLTVENQPTTPDTGFALISSNPLLTLGVTAGAALILVGMARKNRPAHARAHAARRRK
jgi:hypothetical protein